MIIILDREEPDPRAVQRGANNKNMNMKQEGPFLGRWIMTIIIIVIISNYHTMIMNMMMNRGDLIIIIIM